MSLHFPSSVAMSGKSKVQLYTGVFLVVFGLGTLTFMSRVRDSLKRIRLISLKICAE